MSTKPPPSLEVLEPCGLVGSLDFVPAWLEALKGPRWIWVVLQIRAPFRVLSIRVPYCIEDLKRDPNLENYPYIYIYIYIHA